MMNATYQFIAEALFIMFILLTMSGSVLAVKARVLMHSVLGLAVCLLGVAGLYFYLGSMFLKIGRAHV
jgi:NADH-quinone oxidoreductase subunit J